MKGCLNCLISYSLVTSFLLRYAIKKGLILLEREYHFVKK